VSKVIVPINSPWVVSYSACINFVIVSVTAFEIFNA